jgi:outer membrane protein OmpA-like peptidoglycan-associated protein
VLVLLAVAGFVSPQAGCATRELVLGEILHSEATLGPAIDRFRRDLHQRRTAGREIAVTAAEASRLAEEAMRSAIEARGVADIAAGLAAEAADRAREAGTRADRAREVADQAWAKADRTARRLTDPWIAATRPAVIDTIVLRFGVDRRTTDDAMPAVAQTLAKRLGENPALVVHIEGHAPTLAVGEWQAETVRRSLVEHGVEAHRVTTIGLSARRPPGGNPAEGGRHHHPRVVVRLLDPT